VKNANFVVLKNFEMPAVLLEIGFISNSTELQNLVNPKFQELTATLVYNAINSYFAENDPSFQPRYIAPKSGQF
jgi:N-acetylmuramoyl-L-alanine amidase